MSTKITKIYINYSRIKLRRKKMCETKRQNVGMLETFYTQCGKLGNFFKSFC